jgi:hypothetical protein
MTVSRSDSGQLASATVSVQNTGTEPVQVCTYRLSSKPFIVLELTEDRGWRVTLTTGPGGCGFGWGPEYIAPGDTRVFHVEVADMRVAGFVANPQKVHLPDGRYKAICRVYNMYAFGGSDVMSSSEPVVIEIGR